VGLAEVCVRARPGQRLEELPVQGFRRRLLDQLDPAPDPLQRLAVSIHQRAAHIRPAPVGWSPVRGTHAVPNPSLRMFIPCSPSTPIEVPAQDTRNLTR